MVSHRELYQVRKVEFTLRVVGFQPRQVLAEYADIHTTSRLFQLESLQRN